MLSYSESAKEKAKRLRKNMTLPESLFWSRVRSNKLGVHFRRQVPFGPYILDFLCLKAKLVIELDGSQHLKKEAIEYDHHRDEYLRMYGFTVVRFKNEVLLADCDGVVNIIRSYIDGEKTVEK